MSNQWTELFNAKFKIFRGFFLSGFVSGGMFLFGHSFVTHTLFLRILEFLIKVFATFVLAFASGIGGVIATPAWKAFVRWVKKKIKKKPQPPQYGENFSSNGHSTNNKKAS